MDKKTLDDKKKLYMRVFNTDDGQKVLEELQKSFFINTSTYNQDPNRVIFNEGQRSVILFILERLSKFKE